MEFNFFRENCPEPIQKVFLLPIPSSTCYRMPPIHTHETVIDLSSSPSSPIPTPVNVPIPPRPRVQTRAKPPSQTFGGKERARSHTPSTNSTEVGTSRNGQGRKDRDNARVKGKQRALKTLGSVIELTDSEDEGPTGRDPRPIGDPHKPSSSPMVGAASGASSSSALPDVHHTINGVPLFNFVLFHSASSFSFVQSTLKKPLDFRPAYTMMLGRTPHLSHLSTTEKVRQRNNRINMDRPPIAVVVRRTRRMVATINWKYHGQNPTLALATTENQWLVQLSNLQ